MARTEPITRLEVAACPTHRLEVKHYVKHDIGCDCLTQARRDDLTARLDQARRDGNPLADMAE